MRTGRTVSWRRSWSRRPPIQSSATTSGGGPLGWVVLRFLLRYLVIGVAAWLLLVKLHAHPLGLFAGVTAPFLALTLEAVRLQRQR